MLNEYHKQDSGEVTALADEDIIDSDCGSGYCNYVLEVYNNRGWVNASFQAAISLIDGAADRISE